MLPVQFLLMVSLPLTMIDPTVSLNLPKFPSRPPFGCEKYIENEDKILARMLELTTAKIDNDKKVNKDQISRRDAHSKAHGLFRSLFTLNNDIPDELKSNPFFANPGRTFDSLVRFSNGNSMKNTGGDLRGMAVKLFNVEGQKLKKGEENLKVMDLITINADSFVAKDTRDFVELMNAAINGSTFSVPLWLITHPKGAFIFLSSMLKGAGDGSLAELTYHSQINYGVTEDKIIRFAFFPVLNGPKAKRPEEKDINDDYFENEIYKKLQESKNQGITFDFKVQIRDKKDVPTSEIEDATTGVNLKLAPFVSVGKLVILPQTRSPAMNEMAENISFNIWRAPLRALGSVGRSRADIYEKSLIKRREENGIAVTKEPESFEEALKILRKKTK